VMRRTVWHGDLEVTVVRGTTIASSDHTTI
jgi:hypothetical protein